MTGCFTVNVLCKYKKSSSTMMVRYSMVRYKKKGGVITTVTILLSVTHETVMGPASQ